MVPICGITEFQPYSQNEFVTYQSIFTLKFSTNEHYCPKHMHYTPPSVEKQVYLTQYHLLQETNFKPRQEKYYKHNKSKNKLIEILKKKMD